MPPLLGHGTKQTSTKYKLKSRNQIIIKHACGRGLRYISVAKGGQGARRPIEMLPMTKMSQKRLLCLQFEFLSASSRTRVHAYKSN